MQLPRSKLARAAHDLVESYMSPVYFRHSLRSYGCARAFAVTRQLEYDDEGLYLAFLFHDAGLFPPVRDRARAFQIVSGQSLREFMQEYNQDQERVDRLVEAIEYHMLPFPRWGLSTEAGLLHVGAWMDALHWRRWTVRGELARLEEELPRGAFIKEALTHVVNSVGSPRAVLGMLVPSLGRRL